MVKEGELKEKLLRKISSRSLKIFHKYCLCRDFLCVGTTSNFLMALSKSEKE